MSRKVISTGNAPKAVGPYSQAIQGNGFVYLSGQLPLDPITGEFTGTDVTTQTRQCLENIKAVLAAVGVTLAAVVKTTVFLKDMNNFAEMNKVYAVYFPQDPPARSTIEVARLPKEARVEIEAVALEAGR
jgi:2-iminobutanoate/2-iminopropanoate deaminase